MNAFRFRKLVCATLLPFFVLFQGCYTSALFRWYSHSPSVAHLKTPYVVTREATSANPKTDYLIVTYSGIGSYSYAIDMDHGRIPTSLIYPGAQRTATAIVRDLPAHSIAYPCSYGGKCRFRFTRKQERLAASLSRAAASGRATCPLGFAFFQPYHSPELNVSLVPWQQDAGPIDAIKPWGPDDQTLPPGAGVLVLPYSQSVKISDFVLYHLKFGAKFPFAVAADVVTLPCLLYMALTLPDFK